jgi:hypothetical protein
MAMIDSIIALLFLLFFFSFLGLGVSNARTAKANCLLLPVFGYAAVIGLSYFISANCKTTGPVSVGCAILILMSSFILRIKSFAHSWRDITKNLYMFFAVSAIPIFTLILPFSLIGYKYFYGYVNYDFFYNAQDSWYLITHNVLQFNASGSESTAGVVPLDWSPNFSGRIGVGILGAFFAKVLHFDVLQFNSLLLNTIVIMFALSIAVLSKDFFRLNNKAILLAVFFSVMSAGYVQAYCYYVLGQISVIPVFIVFCIFLKRFIDAVLNRDDIKKINLYVIILVLLFNVLFVMYAIISFFAILLMVLSYSVFLYSESTQQKKYFIYPLLKVLIGSIILFCLVRLLMVHESINILKSWMTLSNRVANGNGGTLNTFIVFSEYLTESALALFFGLANYVTTTSIFADYITNIFTRNLVLIIAGIAAFITTVFIIRYFAVSNKYSKGARVIVTNLFVISILFVGYFFYTWSGYGIFKLQTWFMPILIPLYVYFIIQSEHIKWGNILKLSCVLILILNLMSGLIYLSDFSKFNPNKSFLSVGGVTGNRDIIDVANKLHNSSNISLFLNNGLEVAWISELIRDVKLDKIVHNSQPLVEKDFTESSCSKHKDISWVPSGNLLISNPYVLMRSDIVDPPVGGNVVYQNNSYVVLDPNKLETLMYIGEGSYPVEYVRNQGNLFPSKFRWVEKGVEVMIYSRQAKLAHLSVEITPGFVKSDNLARKIIIKMANDQHEYAINSKTTLTVDKIRLHKGLNCITVESADNVSQGKRYGAYFRSNVPLDARLTNFAISRVTLR